MAILDDDRTKRLRAALRACELRMRNWSAPGEWVFAIYTHDDQYIGCVRLHEQTMNVRAGRCRNTRMEQKVLEQLCAAYNATRDVPCG